MWFRINEDILAVGLPAEQNSVEFIPEGEVVEVCGEVDREHRKMIHVRWNGMSYALFNIDLASGSERVTPARPDAAYW